MGDAPPEVSKGVCYALFAYEVGLSIDLDECERRVQALKERATLRHKRRAPRYFQYHPAPLRVMQEGDAIPVGAHRTAGNVDLLLFDFGAVSVTYAIPFTGPLTELEALSGALYDHPVLLADSRRRVEQLIAVIESAVERGWIAEFVEPYAIFQIETFTAPCAPATLATTWGDELAQILRAEPGPLSEQEVADALACRLSFGRDDMVVIDWDAAVLVDRNGEDVRDVLEFANVELLELRWLDQKLDDALDESYDRLVRRRGGKGFLQRTARVDLTRVGRLQLDSAVLFEEVNNALKLLGDQYLARVYRLVSGRFHLAEWDGSILRKLQTLESIYQKMSDARSSRRLEVLEWIVIVLIAAEIVVSLVGVGK